MSSNPAAPHREFPEIVQAIFRAVTDAKERRHEAVTLEHLLASILQEPDVQEVISALDVDREMIEDNLEVFLSGGSINEVSPRNHPRPTMAFDTVVKSAIGTAIWSSRRRPMPVDLLLWLAQQSQDESFAVAILTQSNLTPLRLKKYLAHGLKSDQEDIQGDFGMMDGQSPVKEFTSRAEAETFLAKYCQNLNETAREGNIDPLIGRETEVAHLIQNTARRTKNNTVLVGEPGVGKAQPMYASVLTPSGFKRMGDMVVGDTVVTPDGHQAKVIGVYPQGVKPIYRVTLKDGRSTDCCDEHLWKVFQKNWKRTGDGSGFRIVELSEIRENLEKKSRQYLPLGRGMVDGNSQLPLDPYVLGVLIGDGCITGGRVDFSTADEEILCDVQQRLVEGYTTRHRGGYDYRIKMEVRNGTNSYRRVLSDLGLYGKKSFSKFIPDVYSIASENARWELLRGLLDTDGTVTKTGAVSFCTTSIDLAVDVQRLVWSLGGVAKIKQDQKVYTHKDERRLGRLAYNVSIRHPEPTKLFTLDRKKKRTSNTYQYSDLKVEIESVHFVGEFEAQCIMIDHQDHLYVTDDYIVTHNTAIAEGLAAKIVQGEVPECIGDAIVYSLDVGALMAGTRFRGDLEERLKQVLRAMDFIPQGILFIDEIHTIMGTGSGQQGSLDVANMLKPALAKGTLRCIGSTTAEEFRKHFEKDRALMRRFKRLDVSEPSVEDAKAILRGLKSRYEEFHGVQYTDAAVDAAVELTARYINSALLPDKAIDILDNAGARQRVSPAENRKVVLDVQDIETEISKVARIPEKAVREDETAKLLTLETDLQSAVFGQDQALLTLANAVFVARSGLRDPNKPSGSFLFAGPTGVGKTEAARQLAKTLGVPLLKYDMSEYMERHSVSKLIGAAPGYVGYQDGNAGSGKLINDIDSNPHCVLLLDEIEKAHEDVYNILLQIMDDSRLTSSSGKTVDFRNAIIIMTTNAGAAEAAKNSMGFGKTEGGDPSTAIKRQFSPEFRNRLDATVQFSKLKAENVILIVEKFLKTLSTQALERKVVLVVEEDAKAWLARHGFDDQMGARPLARAIHDQIKTPLSRLMVVGDLRHGGTATVRVQDNKIVVESVG